MATFHNIQAIVTDIEGTTSSISFVKDVLFPYAKKNLAQYVYENSHKKEVKEQLDQVALDCNIPSSDTVQIIQQLLNWIDSDTKATPLKTLQGMIWQQGYENNDYQAHMYDDAVSLLNHWSQNNIPLFVYSSGSVLAQKLFFKYSSAGDLLPLFKDHFDTHIGHKQDHQSYEAIQKQLTRPANEILFLSDIIEELDAAQKAGFQTCHILRDKTALTSQVHPCISSFQQITLSR